MTKPDGEEGGLTDRQMKAIPHLVASISYEKGVFSQSSG
jgi:hypothetical protein